MRSIPGVVFHHTGWAKKTVLSVPGQAGMNLIDQGHRAKGYIMSGYQYGLNEVSSGGPVKIYDGRPDSWQGAHTLGEGNDYIGVCVFYPYQDGVIADKFIQKAAELVAELSDLYGFQVNRGTILGHKDFMPNICPGDPLYKRIPEIIALANKIKAGELTQPDTKQIPQPQNVGQKSRSEKQTHLCKVIIEDQSYDGILVNDYSFILASSVADHLDLEIDWDNDSKTAKLTAKGASDGS